MSAGRTNAVSGGGGMVETVTVQLDPVRSEDIFTYVSLNENGQYESANIEDTSSLVNVQNCLKNSIVTLRTIYLYKCSGDIERLSNTRYLINGPGKIEGA